MKRTTILAAVILAGALAALEGCGGSSGNTGGSGGGTGGSATTTTTTTTTGTGGSTSSSSGTGGTPMNPPPPTLGAQIDRFGRPAINTALNHTFDAMATTKDKAKDDYNADGNQAMWPATYASEFAANLAILDALDTMCGNQILAGPMPVAGRYNTLAGALASDVLYLKTDAATCSAYLAVEANATGLLANVDCGGRKLDYDVIDISYSALAAGALQGVDDGIPADNDTKGTTFPYLAAPH